MLVCIWLLVVDGGDDTIDLIIFTWVAAVVIRVPKWHGRRGNRSGWQNCGGGHILAGSATASGSAEGMERQQRQHDRRRWGPVYR
jgi:hypothetical protein